MRHMSARYGMESGKRVRQGQVIGFIGRPLVCRPAPTSTTKPGQRPFRRPDALKLPRGRSLEGPMLANFEKERDRIDAQMNSRGSSCVVSDATGSTGSRPVSNRQAFSSKFAAGGHGTWRASARFHGYATSNGGCLEN